MTNINMQINHILAISILVIYSIFLISNLNFFESTANMDVIQYISDGRAYFNLILPSNIHASPLYPILITAISYLVPPSILFPELVAAKMINIVSVVLTLYLVYLITYTYFDKFTAIFIMFWGMLHPLVFLMAVGDSSETIFTLLIFISLYFYAVKKNIQLTFIFAGLSFLARNEGAVYFGALSIMALIPDISEKLSFKTALLKIKINFMNKGFILGLAMIIFWILVILFRTHCKTQA